METFDVLVSGAGLAGLTVARHAARAGFRVLIVDRKSAVDDNIQTTGIFVRRTLEDFELPESCLGPVVRDVTLHAPSLRRRLELRSACDEFRVGRMPEIYRHALAGALQAGAVAHFGSAYVHSATSREGSRVVLREGAVTTRVSARVVIGADGAVSRVAADLGLAKNREFIVGVEDVLRREAPSRDLPRFHCILDPRIAPGYIAWIVDDGEDPHIGAGGYAERFNPLDALAAVRRAAEEMVDLRSAAFVGRRGGKIPVNGLLREIGCRRGLLVGDAAGAVSPLTAGGLDAALRLSHAAAEVVVESLRRDDPAILERYSGDAVRTRFISRLWMRRAIAAMRSPVWAECAITALRIAPFAARHVFFGRGSFPDVRFVPVGRRLPA
ncbi:MAG: FAD-dependent monooxygenase [Thermoanaerobaculia bacterium]